MIEVVIDLHVGPSELFTRGKFSFIPKIKELNARAQRAGAGFRKWRT
jgi:hypothetical protein